MNDRNKQRLADAGIDADDMLGRFMGLESMAMKFLRRFPQDPSMQALREALDRGDAQGAYEAAHTLKGVAGNLSMKPLLEQSSAITDSLREGDLAGAAERMPQLEACYRRTVECLQGLED